MPPACHMTRRSHEYMCMCVHAHEYSVWELERCDLRVIHEYVYVRTCTLHLRIRVQYVPQHTHAHARTHARTWELRRRDLCLKEGFQCCVLNALDAVERDHALVGRDDALKLVLHGLKLLRVAPHCHQAWLWELVLRGHSCGPSAELAIGWDSG